MSGKSVRTRPAKTTSLRQKMWQSMRIMKRFTIPDIMRTVPGSTYTNVCKFFNRLEKSGFVGKVGTYVSGRSATAAALKLSGSDSAAQSIGIELLADIQEIFEQKRADRISSADLIKELCSDDERPWATYNRGFQITPRQIASKLKGYGIHSKTIRTGFGETPKGYELNQLKEAFSRYIPSTPLVSATTPQTSNQAALPVADVPPCCGSVADGKHHNMLESKTCCVVADREPFSASEVIDLTGIDFEVIG